MLLPPPCIKFCKTNFFTRAMTAKPILITMEPTNSAQSHLNHKGVEGSSKDTASFEGDQGCSSFFFSEEKSLQCGVISCEHQSRQSRLRQGIGVLDRGSKGLVDVRRRSCELDTGFGGPGDISQESYGLERGSKALSTSKGSRRPCGRQLLCS